MGHKPWETRRWNTGKATVRTVMEVGQPRSGTKIDQAEGERLAPKSSVPISPTDVKRTKSEPYVPRQSVTHELR